MPLECMTWLWRRVMTELEQIESGGVLRALLALCMALLVVVALMSGMQQAISPGGQSIGERSAGRLLEFVRIEHAPAPPAKTETLPPPPPVPPVQPKVPPLPGKQPAVATLPIPQLTPQLAAPDLDGNFALPGLGEGDYLPLVKVAPVYPPRARRRGIEGYCTVSYTVTAQGQVADLRVLPSQCSHELFHETVLQAAQRFRYKPRIVEGQAVAVLDVQTRFNFRLDDH